jgi:hypothetical protein
MSGDGGEEEEREAGGRGRAEALDVPVAGQSGAEDALLVREARRARPPQVEVSGQGQGTYQQPQVTSI